MEDIYYILQSPRSSSFQISSYHLGLLESLYHSLHVLISPLTQSTAIWFPLLIFPVDLFSIRLPEDSKLPDPICTFWALPYVTQHFT